MDPSGRAIPPTLYMAPGPQDPTLVAKCKTGLGWACAEAGMTEAEIEVYFAERGVVTRVASQEVVEEVTKEIIVHSPKVGILGSIGRAIGIGGGAGFVTGVVFTTAQVATLRRGCASGDAAFCEILDRYGLGRAPDRSAIPGVDTAGIGTVPTPGIAAAPQERQRAKESPECRDLSTVAASLLNAARAACVQLFPPKPGSGLPGAKQREENIKRCMRERPEVAVFCDTVLLCGKEQDGQYAKRFKKYCENEESVTAE